MKTVLLEGYVQTEEKGMQERFVFFECDHRLLCRNTAVVLRTKDQFACPAFQPRNLRVLNGEGE